jgi:hypothetical protein
MLSRPIDMSNGCRQKEWSLWNADDRGRHKTETERLDIQAALANGLVLAHSELALIQELLASNVKSFYYAILVWSTHPSVN